MHLKIQWITTFKYHKLTKLIKIGWLAKLKKKNVFCEKHEVSLEMDKSVKNAWDKLLAKGALVSSREDDVSKQRFTGMKSTTSFTRMTSASRVLRGRQQELASQWWRQQLLSRGWRPQLVSWGWHQQVSRNWSLAKCHITSTISLWGWCLKMTSLGKTTPVIRLSRINISRNDTRHQAS